ncbi:hypothetical protein BJY52DRAFT_1220085 [Lactarius psammicola]|nr:hypothetical protein BJY52DRAFT_1220085 [Lactarius psammicola]
MQCQWAVGKVLSRPKVELECGKVRAAMRAEKDSELGRTPASVVRVTLDIETQAHTQPQAIMIPVPVIIRNQPKLTQEAFLMNVHIGTWTCLCSQFRSASSRQRPRPGTITRLSTSTSRGTCIALRAARHSSSLHAMHTPIYAAAPTVISIWTSAAQCSRLQTQAMELPTGTGDAHSFRTFPRLIRKDSTGYTYLIVGAKRTHAASTQVLRVLPCLFTHSVSSATLEENSAHSKMGPTFSRGNSAIFLSARVPEHVDSNACLHLMGDLVTWHGSPMRHLSNLSTDGGTLSTSPLSVSITVMQLKEGWTLLAKRGFRNLAQAGRHPNPVSVMQMPW